MLVRSTCKRAKKLHQGKDDLYRGTLRVHTHYEASLDEDCKIVMTGPGGIDLELSPQDTLMDVVDLGMNPWGLGPGRRGKRVQAIQNRLTKFAEQAGITRKALHKRISKNTNSQI